MKSIDINEAVEKGYEPIIDVREPSEFAEGSVPGARNIPMIGLIMNAGDFLDKDETYYIMCRSGGRSSQTCSELESQGYNVVNLEGGILGYNN